MPSHSEEIKLIEQCLRGDDQAQATLYHRHKAALFGVCLRYAADREEAKDWLQDAFVHIFNDLHQFKPVAPVGAWMRKVTVNTALMYLRKRRNLFSQTPVESLPDLPDEDENEPLHDEDLAKTLLQLVQRLPDGYRTVFNLHVLEGYSHPEIAAMLGIGEGTSKSQLSRAKAMLRRMLENKLTT
ncbi:MAG: sigma-70 family RNA polymerase sigma factor [Bacteroidota bacterium]